MLFNPVFPTECIFLLPAISIILYEMLLPVSFEEQTAIIPRGIKVEAFDLQPSENHKNAIHKLNIG